MPTSNATAVWEGGLKAGRGHFKAGSASFEGDYSFRTRFEGVEALAAERGLAIDALDLTELDALWDEVKRFSSR